MVETKAWKRKSIFRDIYRDGVVKDNRVVAYLIRPDEYVRKLFITVSVCLLLGKLIGASNRR